MKKEAKTSINGIATEVEILGTRIHKKLFGYIQEPQTLVSYEETICNWAGCTLIEKTAWVPSSTVKRYKQ